MKNWKRRIALLCAVSITVVLFAGCGHNTGQEEPVSASGTEQESGAGGGETITLRMIDSLASESRTAALKTIIQAYEKEHSHIKIELISPPTENADQKIQQMLMSNEQLDIIDTGNGFPVCLNNGWVQPLNSYLEGWEGMDTLSDAAKSRMTIYAKNGTDIWCIPYGIYQKLLFYRVDRFQEADITPPEVWTWQDVYEIGVKLTQPENGKYGFAFRGGTRGQFEYDYLLLSYLGDDALLDNESYRGFTSDGGSIYRRPEALEALEFYKKLYTDCSPEDSISWGFTEMVQGFMSGTCAMLMQDNDVIQSCESGLDPAVWTAAMVPLGPSGYGTQSCGFGGWALTSKTDHPEEAADFLKYLSSAENNGYFCEQTGLLPIHTTTLESNAYFSSGVYNVFNDMDAISEKYRIFQSWGVDYTFAATFGTDRDEYLQKYLKDQVEASDLLDYWASSWEKVAEEEGQLWQK